MIAFDRVNIRYGAQVVLRDVTLHLRDEEKIVCCGKSGSGKSTVLKAVMGGCIPFSGTVTVRGKRVSPENLSAIREQIAYIAQEPLLGAETVREAIYVPFTFKAHRHSLPSEQSVVELMERFNLAPSILGQKSSSVSGGEKQRIAILRAVLLKKTIFLIDEATSALDPESKEKVIDFLLAPGHTVFSASHDAGWMERCDRVVRIEDGRLQEDMRSADT